jgi:NAD(P)-dependent dehydrogenase (short-subunit alcohol dehydrogenase family)
MTDDVEARRRSAAGTRDHVPVAVVTGASAGVGRALARALAQRGYRLGLLARGQDGLEGARRDVEALGGEAIVCPVDVADASAVEAAADRIVDRWGRIDLWINNAMATVFSPIEHMTADEFRRVTEVTYLGQVHGTLAALKHMRPRDRGTIVQVGSSLSYRAIPLQSAYCAAKFAVRGFTDSLRSELIHAKSRIRLTMVQLPAVNTPQFDWARNHLRRRPQPVPPIFQPEAVADAIVEAAMSAPREYWIGGPSLQAILGTMVAPGFLDRFLSSRAWDGQMTPARARPDSDRGNLFEPRPGDHGAHGRFDRRSRRSLVAVSSNAARLGIAALALGMGAAALATGYVMGRRETRPAWRPASVPRRRIDDSSARG